MIWEAGRGGGGGKGGPDGRVHSAGSPLVAGRPGSPSGNRGQRNGRYYFCIAIPNQPKIHIFPDTCVYVAPILLGISGFLV